MTATGGGSKEFFFERSRSTINLGFQGGGSTLIMRYFAFLKAKFSDERGGGNSRTPLWINHWANTSYISTAESRERIFCPHHGSPGIRGKELVILQREMLTIRNQKKKKKRCEMWSIVIRIIRNNTVSS